MSLWSLLNIGGTEQSALSVIVSEQSERIAELETQLKRSRRGQVAPPQARVDLQRSLKLSMADIQAASPNVLQCALQILGMYVQVDAGSIARIFDAMNLVASVDDGYGAAAEEIMVDCSVGHHQTDDLVLTLAAILVQIFYQVDSANDTFAAVHLQYRGYRTGARADASRKPRVKEQVVEADTSPKGGGTYGI